MDYLRYSQLGLWNIVETEGGVEVQKEKAFIDGCQRLEQLTILQGKEMNSYSDAFEITQDLWTVMSEIRDSRLIISESQGCSGHVRLAIGQEKKAFLAPECLWLAGPPEEVCPTMGTLLTGVTRRAQVHWTGHARRRSREGLPGSQVPVIGRTAGKGVPCYGNLTDRSTQTVAPN
ncbi:collagen alpha-1(I) chain-like isoform X17 [Prionailurus iriomotensis]